MGPKKSTDLESHGGEGTAMEGKTARGGRGNWNEGFVWLVGGGSFGAAFGFVLVVLPHAGAKGKRRKLSGAFADPTVISSLSHAM